MRRQERAAGRFESGATLFANGAIQDTYDGVTGRDLVNSPALLLRRDDDDGRDDDDARRLECDGQPTARGQLPCRCRRGA